MLRFVPRPRVSAIALSLAAATLSSLALAPTTASACITGEEFIHTISDLYPADGATTVPYDTVVAAFGSNLADHLQVEVSDLGGIIPGTLVSVGGRVFWRPDAPLDPESEYSVHLWTEDANASENVDQVITFTTGSEPAPPIEPPTFALSLSKWDKVYTKCVEQPEPGECGDCGKEEVTKVEERMRVSITIDPPSGPFGRFYIGRMRHGASEADVKEGADHASEWWGDPDQAITVKGDLGLVGTWEGEEVCVRGTLWDPRDLTSAPIATCAAIGDVNVPSPTGETDSDSDSDSAGTDSDSSGTDSGSDSETGSASDSGPGPGSSSDTDDEATGGGVDDDEGSCACRADDDRPGALSLAFGLGLLLLRTRRRRSAQPQASSSGS